jgi:hypothetical protein
MARKFVVALFLLAVGAGVALAAIPDRNGVIHGCRNTRTGLLRVIKSTAHCRVGERALNWNVRGPQGPQGRRGRRVSRERAWSPSRRSVGSRATQGRTAGRSRSNTKPRARRTSVASCRPWRRRFASTSSRQERQVRRPTSSSSWSTQGRRPSISRATSSCTARPRERTMPNWAPCRQGRPWPPAPSSSSAAQDTQAHTRLTARSTSALRRPAAGWVSAMRRGSLSTRWRGERGPTRSSKAQLPPRRQRLRRLDGQTRVTRTGTTRTTTGPTSAKATRRRGCRTSGSDRRCGRGKGRRERPPPSRGRRGRS